MPVWLIIGATALYIGLLFAIAWRTDRRAEQARSPLSPLVYTFALAVYCTSWTFYGAVGTAAASGWMYLPIYLGPALVFLLMPSFIRRIGDVAQRESITSLSDFLAARYGKSRTLGVIVTLAAISGALPYIALQLKSVGMSFQALADTQAEGQASGEPHAGLVLAIALMLALFAVLFGARHADTTRRNPGLMYALAFESLVKLLALAAVCLLSFFILDGADPARVGAARGEFAHMSPMASFLTVTILSMAAIICLPRQFHVAIIERGEGRDIRVASLLFPLYLLATSLFVIPITLAGLSALPDGVAPDLFVLALPLSEGRDLLALFVFLGGFSAATGMVIVSTVALSIMVTNELVVPALMRAGRMNGLGQAGGAQLVMVRRAVMFAIVLMAWLYYRSAGSSEALAQIGLLAFAAAAQFAPALVAGLYWRTAHRNGAVAGLVIGTAIWAYTLFLPAIFGIGTLRAAGLTGGLDPHGLFGLDIADPLVHGSLLSLSANIAALLLLSVRARVRLRDRIQASVFTSPGEPAPGQAGPVPGPTSGATVNGLKALAARFLSAQAVDLAFEQFRRDTGLDITGEEPADWRLVQRTERLLASALGASSARVVMASALAGSAVSLSDVLSILDQQTQAERFDRHMLQSMLENVSQGISVVDHEQRLVAWNSTYVDMFDYPAGLIQLGRPIGDLIRHNIERGWIDADDREDEILRRVERMRAGAPYSFERENPDGTWLRIVGSPMPGGGYVTTFTDITVDKRRERDLIELNASLEARVEERTEALRDMASDLDRARQEAERANASKSSFLAAASHDLLQPLNAARLFLGALGEKVPPGAGGELVAKSDRAIASADQLLKGLLDLSRLDQGEVEAEFTTLPVQPLLEDLVDEARPMARQVGLDIRLVPARLSVRADPDFLQSILRNFISNARRYTQKGRILVGARRRGAKVRFEVWDTGPGIPAERLDEIFDAFRRFEESDNIGIRGAGLGLAIAHRLAGLMGAKIGVRSRPGKGSVFWLEVDRAMTHAPAAETRSAPSPAAGAQPFTGLDVLCVDDEPAIVEAMTILLASWGAAPRGAASVEEALAAIAGTTPALLLLDLQLSETETGFDLLDRISLEIGAVIPAALLTASLSDDTLEAARARGLDVLRKPVDPAELRELVTRLAGTQGRQAAE